MFNSQSQYIHVELNPTSTVWHLRLGSYRGKIKEHLHLFSGLFIPRSRTVCGDRSRPIKHWVNGGGRSTTLPWAKILPTFGHFKGHHIARKRGMRTKAIQPKVVIWINISNVTLEVNKRPDGPLSLLLLFWFSMQSSDSEFLEGTTSVNLAMKTCLEMVVGLLQSKGVMSKGVDHLTPVFDSILFAHIPCPFFGEILMYFEIWPWFPLVQEKRREKTQQLSFVYCTSSLQQTECNLRSPGNFVFGILNEMPSYFT